MSPARQRGKVRGRERGQALAEFAVVALVFFFLVFAIFDFARLFQSWVTVQHAAREGARFAVTGQDTCTAYTGNRSGCITYITKKATYGITGGGESGSAVSVAITNWDYPGYTTSSSGPGDQCDAVQVAVTYTHHFVTPIISAIAPGGISLTGSQRMLNEPYGPCG